MELGRREFQLLERLTWSQTGKEHPPQCPSAPASPAWPVPVSPSGQESPGQWQAAPALSHKQRLRAPELGVFMQSQLARGPHQLYLSNVCAAGDGFREKGLLEDNTQKGEEKSK